MFLEESNLYEIKNIVLIRGGDPAKVTMDAMTKWVKGSEANDILFMESPSNAMYILDSLNEAFANTIVQRKENTKDMMFSVDPYSGEINVPRQVCLGLTSMRRVPSKKYRSESKGLHAKLATLETQRESITVDSVIAKKALNIFT